MSVLTGQCIQQCVSDGTIIIDPFDSARLNPNSYNYTLGDTLLTRPQTDLEDPHTPCSWSALTIPVDGFVLAPGHLYLAATTERIGSDTYVPSLIGRSSLGRLGMFLQLSADIGNLGCVHHWTLEITVVQRLRVYAGMAAGQVSFWRVRGDIHQYVGRYISQNCPTPNRDLFPNTGVHRDIT